MYMDRKRVFFLLTVLSTFLVLYVAFVPLPVDQKKMLPMKSKVRSARNWTEQATQANKLSVNRKAPLILFWDHPWFVKAEGCREGKKFGICDSTYNRGRLKEADAVVFHYTVIRPGDLPWKLYRNPEQVFVWWSLEGPAVLQLEGVNLPAFDGFFNWTMTYRRDADVIQRYGYRGDILNSVTKGKKAVDDVIAAKTSLAVGNLYRPVAFQNFSIIRQIFRLGSLVNVETPGAKMRMKLANELKKAGLEFTGYGNCLNRPLDGSLTISEVSKYKFYFAFENALHCTDYITEKFWRNALLSGSVPVVWGPRKQDLLRIAPLDSFIFVEDFESAEKLSEYLMFLDKNETEYRKYFRWREDENMTDEKMIELTKQRYPGLDVAVPVEGICEKLLRNDKTQVIGSLKSQFWDRNPIECSKI
ncbi:alpha-(1,3)-fucosyltransferase 7-like [Clavelina lepadiformis]|uniref:alpha-(1,3)-fucosyltransferase 7-like n=1 Tax=Clavelina lepadiformis TaxID=159417 RepID=UPI0040435925